MPLRITTARMNKLGKLFDILPSFRRSTIGIDIGTRSAKIAEVVWRNHEPTVKNTGIIDMPPGVIVEGKITACEPVTELLRRLVLDSGVSGKRAIAAVGGRSVLLRELVFPNLNRKELKAAIRWEMEKYIPGFADNWYYDYVRLERSANTLKLLLAAVPHDLINTLAQVVNQAGLCLLAVDLQPLAVYRFLTGEDNCIIIDIGAWQSQISIFVNKIPLGYRTIPVGGEHFIKQAQAVLPTKSAIQDLFWQQPAEPEKIAAVKSLTGGLWKELAEGLVQEINNTLLFFRTQIKSVKPAKVYLVGGGSKIYCLVEFLRDKLDTEIGREIRFAGDKQATGSLANDYLASLGPRIATAVGLALYGGPYGLH